MDVQMRRLDECTPETVDIIADVYMAEWAWHYAEEWDIRTAAEMIDDLRANYMDCTYVATLPDGSFVGTVALLDSDLKSHTHLAPWVTCLYVVPGMRRRGLGRFMVDFACEKAGTTCYLWCYTDAERETYYRWGFELIDTAEYANDRKAFVMSNIG